MNALQCFERIYSNELADVDYDIRHLMARMFNIPIPERTVSLFYAPGEFSSYYSPGKFSSYYFRFTVDTYGIQLRTGPVKMSPARSTTSLVAAFGITPQLTMEECLMRAYNFLTEEPDIARKNLGLVRFINAMMRQYSALFPDRATLPRDLVERVFDGPLDFRIRTLL